MSYFCDICEVTYPSREAHKHALLASPMRRSLHGFEVIYTDEAFFPLPNEVLKPSQYLKSTGPETVWFLPEVIRTVYNALKLRWHDRYVGRVSKYPPVPATRLSIREPVKQWLSRFAKDEEARNIFLMTYESCVPSGVLLRGLDYDELLVRVAELFDLPQFWYDI